MVKITQDYDACIGCGACAAICPKEWDFKGDKAELIGGTKEGNLFVKEVEEVGCNKEAANACPVQCIKIIE